ncbi:MAG: hypothetical protein GX638_14150 [Crenarchaeota archaeon]|nr:hypothetical protein [Thermoproteota archaeon]
MNHMRTLFEQENPEKDFIPSKAMFDTEKFIKNISQNQISTIDEDVIGNIAEISSEIIDNCFQHSDGDCLYDVKCFPIKSNKLFVSLNFISLTNDFIGKELIDLYKRKELKKYSGYKIVKKAYKYHSKHFSSNYNDGSFGFVCSFQEKVSTRENSVESGGTGLTALIKNIHNKSFDDNYMSYVISANNTLVFDNNFLKVSEEGNIGFNSKNNFFKCLPENKIVIKEKYTFPGTIFSINLIL